MTAEVSLLSFGQQRISLEGGCSWPVVPPGLLREPGLVRNLFPKRQSGRTSPSLALPALMDGASRQIVAFLQNSLHSL